MATDFLFNPQYRTYLTRHDFVILAKAEGVVDEGRISVYGTKTRPTPREGEAYRYHALEVDGGTNLYIGGADYSGDTLLPAYNIHIATSNAVDIGTQKYETAAVNLTSGATIRFTAQTGAKLASVNADSKLRFHAAATTYWETHGGIGSTYLPGPQETTAVVFQGNSNAIVIDGDVAGLHLAEAVNGNLAGLHYYSSGSKICVDICNGNEFGATAFHAGTMTVGNNVTSSTVLSALVSSNTVAAYNTLTASGNSFFARGIAVDENLTALNGYLGGTISAVVANTTIDAQPDHMEEAMVASGSAGMANVIGNTIEAFGISAGGTVQAAKLNGAVSALVSGVSMIASATHTSTTVVNFSDNTLQAMAIHGGTVTLTDVDSKASLGATVSRVTASLGLAGGSRTASISGNTLNARVIDGENIAIGNLRGTLSAATKSVNLRVTGANTVTSSKFYSVTAGMYASDSITVSGDLAGELNITLSHNGVTGAAGSNLFSFFGGGLVADESITVNGQFNADFNLSVASSSWTRLFGIYTKTLTATAYSGVMSGNARTGIHLSGKAISVYGEDDAFDINGTISVSGGIAFTSVYEVNLRVSGTLSASNSYVIYAEHEYDDYDGWVTDYHTDTNDKVELTDEAKVTGDINLVRGYNTVVINSGAKMTGRLLADEGTMNIVFMLNKNNAAGETPMVSTGIGDVSLSSTASNIVINLNEAVRQSSYKLFDYGTDVADYWASKTVTFLFDGDSYVTTLVNGSANLALKVNGETVDVAIGLEGNQVVVNVGGSGSGEIKKLPKLGSVTGSLSSSGVLSLSWQTIQLGGGYAPFYEIEYQIYDATGEKVGNSIGVTVAGQSAATQNFSLSHLSLNPGERVDYRMRAKSAAGTFLSSWTDWTTKKLAAVDPKENKHLAMTAGSAVYTSFATGDSVTTSVVRFSWEAATTDLAIKHYKVLYVDSETELKIASWGYDANGNPQAKTADGKVLSAYYKEVTGTSVVASELINKSYVYWAVQAVDVAGNASKFIDGRPFRSSGDDDTTPPVFPKDAVSLTLVEDRSNAYAVKYNVTFNWKPAVDASGIYQYILEYKLNDATEWTRKIYDGSTLSATLKNLAGGLYNYRLSAVDNYYGNISDYAVQSSFGKSDLLPPEGSFTSFSATVDSAYTKTTQGQTTTKTYTSASVAFSWAGTFTDASTILYTVECSKSSSFSDKVYRFTTSDQSLTLSMGSTGLPVGVLSGMSTVYWRVSVADSEGNVNPTPGATQSFKFVDDEGDVIKLDNTLAKPTDLKVSASKTSATFSWSDGSASGTYRFILSYTVNGKTTTVDDIASTSYTATGLVSGHYSWTVSALAYSLQKTATAKGADFAVDSAAPGSIKVKSIISVKTNAVLSWNPITTQNTGIKQYVVQYKSASAGTENYTTVTTTDTAVLLSFNTGGNYSYRLYAVDNGGNTSTATTGDFTINPSADFSDVIEGANSITVGNTVRNQSIGGDIDPADFVTFKLNATSAVNVSFANVADLIGSKSGLKVTVYDASGKRVGKSVTVKSEDGGGTLSTFLGAGQYYLGITAQKKAVITSYDFKVTNSVVPINNSDDTPAGANKLAFSGGKAKSAYDWVGYGDTVDYYTFTIARSNTNGATAGNYTFSLTDFTPKNVVLTVYRTLADGSLKKIKNFTATDSKPALSLANLLEGRYYVAVSSKNAKNMVSAKNSYYTLHVTADWNYPLLSRSKPSAVVNRNGYAEYKVAASSADAVLSFASSAQCSVFTDNGKGGFKKARLVNNNLVASAGEIYYVKSSADANQITVTETAYDAVSGKTLTLGKDSTGWVGGKSSEAVWYFNGSSVETWVEIGLDVVSSLGNTAKLKMSVYTDVGGIWTAGPSLSVKSGDDKALEFAAGAKGKYMLVVSGGSAKNAASYTIQSEQTKRNTNASFASASKLSGNKEVSGKVVRDWDPVAVYDVAALSDGRLDWHMTDGSVKLSFFDAAQNAVQVSATLLHDKGTVSTKTASVFALNSAANSSLSLNLAGTSAAYVMAEASGKNGSSFQINTFAVSSASSSELNRAMLA